MDIAGICSICSKAARTLYTCWRCGTQACAEHFDASAGMCIRCSPKKGGGSWKPESPGTAFRK